MAPNLLLAARTVCSPHRWFQPKAERQTLDFVEIWNSPVPGVYRHRPGIGWTLIAAHDTSGFFELDTPIKVIYAKALHRYLFEEDFLDRQQDGFLQDKPRQKGPIPFFRMDDGVTYIQCYDKEGDFIPGPYQRLVFDETTERFRPMLRRDEPEWQKEPVSQSHASSAVSSLHTSRDNSRCASRKSSFEDLRASATRNSSRSNRHRATLQLPSSANTSRSSSHTR